MNQTMMPFRQALFTGKILALLAALMLGGAQMKEADAAARISVLDNDSCAIAADGRVQCWGNNAAYAGAGPGRAMEMTGFPADVAALVGSTGALCALTTAGALWCQGARPGNGSASSLVPVVPVGMGAGVLDVARSHQQVCVAKTDGSVWCWGVNYSGLGDGTSTSSHVPVQVLAAGFDVAGVTVGYSHACAFNHAGQVRCWGGNYLGQLGNGQSGGSEPAPVVVNLPGAVEGVSAGRVHTCAWNADIAYCWGFNNHGQLGDGSQVDAASPVPAGEFGTDLVAVHAGDDFTCAQPVSGGLICRGTGSYRQLAVAGVLDPQSGQVALGHGMGCALVNAVPHCWGLNYAGQAGNGRFGDEFLPVRVLHGGFAQAPSVAFDSGCASRPDGSASCWGGDAAVPPYGHELVTGAGGTIQRTGNGQRFQCVLRDDARVLCRGENHYGMLGDGTTTDRPTLAPLAGVSLDVVQMSIGAVHACAVLEDASVVCWGYNPDGRAGGDDVTSRLLPAPVTGLSGVLQVSAGFTASCAVDDQGEVWCWGNNLSGVIGTGVGSSSPIPVKRSGLPLPVSSVAVGFSHACALLSNGGIACWGAGSLGELGDGQAQNSDMPVLVDSAQTFVQVVAGRRYSCARDENDAIYCWGNPARGQLGLGVQARDSFSIAKPEALGVQAVDLAAMPSGESTCALDAQADAWCWGGNEYAQLGIGRRGVREVPGPVMGAGEEIFADGFEP